MSSTMVDHEFTRYWKEDRTCEKALRIWFMIPSVIFPDTMVGPSTI